MTLTSITTGVAGYIILHTYKIDQAAFSPSDASRASKETRPCVWRKIGTRHLCGTDLRWRHFLTAPQLTRSARAASSTNRHSESFMSQILRDTLSPCKGTDWVETDCPPFFRLGFMRNDPESYSAIAEGYQKRTRQARLESSYTQQEVADLLGVKVDRYKKWENRGGSTMPVEYHANFCFITGTRPDWFMTGKGPRAEKPRVPRQPPQKPKLSEAV